jgi:hypothetical protein
LIFIVLLLTAAVLACIPALIAKSKGRDFALWGLYGFLIFPVALIHSLAISPSIEGLEQQALESGNRKCPSCAEMVKFEARICKHCGSDLEPYVAEVEPDAPTAAEKAIIKIFVISVLIVLALIWLPELLLT